MSASRRASASRPNGSAARNPSERLPWYPWFTGDYLAETQGWPWDARAAYRELLDAQWNMGALPSDPERLRTLVGASRAQWRIAWPFAALKFPDIDGGQRQNATLEARRREWI